MFLLPVMLSNASDAGEWFLFMAGPPTRIAAPNESPPVAVPAVPAEFQQPRSVATFPLLLRQARAISAPEMPDEESSRSEESAAPGKRPRARRSRRGGRGRGRGRKPGAGAAAPPDSEPPAPEAEFAATEERIEAAEPAAEEMPMADSPIEEARHEAADELVREESEGFEEAPVHGEPELPEEAPSLQRPPERSDFRPAPPAAIADAIAEVNQVITSLKQVLDQMEEVLETLELAEVQKSADEREIQSLRNALRQFERRGGTGEPRHEHGSHSHPQQRHDSRRGRHR